MECDEQNTRLPALVFMVNTFGRENKMTGLKAREIWFVTGSQHLYGEETLNTVGLHAREIAEALDGAAEISVKIVWKPTVKTPDEIANIVNDANYDHACAGLICWMHTFSPAKMWIAGLGALNKPLMQLHTQYNRGLPWGKIDMDFMNLNQTALVGREFGFICARMKPMAKVVTGYWRDAALKTHVDTWCRAAAALADSRAMKVARIGDNMREVAVTEGNKVSAQMRFGYSVNGYGLGDLLGFVEKVPSAAVSSLVKEYEKLYSIKGRSSSSLDSIREAARIELGLRAFLSEGKFSAFTTTFEDLHGLAQLPGLAAQRLMADGYGFGAEGDWKTAALVRTMKVMGRGLPGGTSFMEDYTYHLGADEALVLGAHMLEVCPSIAAKGKASLEVHPLGIGGKKPPARLVFNAAKGPALNASLIELRGRFRLIVNEVEALAPPPLPRLPVARAVWRAKPDLETAANAWILAGGAHHTGYSQAVKTEHLEDFAEICGIELVVIDAKTTLREFKDRLRWNEMYYHLGLGKSL